MKTKTQMCSEDTELNQARSKPNTVDRPVRTARIFVQHYNGTQYGVPISQILDSGIPYGHLHQNVRGHIYIVQYVRHP